MSVLPTIHSKGCFGEVIIISASILSFIMPQKCWAAHIIYLTMTMSELFLMHRKLLSARTSLSLACLKCILALASHLNAEDKIDDLKLNQIYRSLLVDMSITVRFYCIYWHVSVWGSHSSQSKTKPYIWHCDESLIFFVHQ